MSRLTAAPDRRTEERRSNERALDHHRAQGNIQSWRRSPDAKYPQRVTVVLHSGTGLDLRTARELELVTQALASAGQAAIRRASHLPATSAHQPSGGQEQAMADTSQTLPADQLTGRDTVNPQPATTARHIRAMVEQFAGIGEHWECYPNPSEPYAIARRYALAMAGEYGAATGTDLGRAIPPSGREGFLAACEIRDPRRERGTTTAAADREPGRRITFMERDQGQWWAVSAAGLDMQGPCPSREDAERQQEWDLCDPCFEAVTGLLAECQDNCSLHLDHTGLCGPYRQPGPEDCQRCGAVGRLTHAGPQA